MGVLLKSETVAKSQSTAPAEEFKHVKNILWINVVYFTYAHLGALYGLYLAFTSAKLMTITFAIFLYIFSAIGITAGNHRLWSHISYKVKWPLEILLLIQSTMAHQSHAIEWARDHRVHHKYSDTNADPYNITNGFFFAHIGWLMSKKHPDVKEKGKGIDISDLESNPILRFQKKYYWALVLIVCFIIPTIVPVVCWNETWRNAYFVCTMLRYVLFWNATWLINSAAHLYGNKPYDKFIYPAENKLVIVMTLGEGWHNYHHAFPWDYKASELGFKLNITAAFIEFFMKIGWAYDLKTVPMHMVKKRVERTGDGHHHLWGWSDKDQTQEEMDHTQ